MIKRSLRRRKSVRISVDLLSRDVMRLWDQSERDSSLDFDRLTEDLIDDTEPEQSDVG